MGDFKREGGFRGNGGGKPRFGGGGGGGFKKPWENRDNRGGDRGEVTMHDARCSNCGKDCQVPFRPTGSKPVFCKECFAAKEGGESGDRGPRRDFDRGQRDDRPRRDFEPRRHDGPRPELRRDHTPHTGGGNDDLKKQVEMLSQKIERLTQSIENLNRTRPMSVKEEAKVQVTPEVKKKSIEVSLKGDKSIKEAVKKSKKKGPIKK